MFSLTIKISDEGRRRKDEAIMKIKIVKKTDEYSSEYQIGDILRLREPGTEECTLLGKQEFRFLWIERNMKKSQI